MRLPVSWLALFAALGTLGLVVALIWFRVVEVSALFFVLTNVFLLTLLFVFAVLGGAFAGMLMTHRMLANREFSPVERTVLETHAEVKAMGARLAALEGALKDRDGAAREREPPQRRA